MEVVIVFTVIVAAVFAGAFVSGRRFGALALSLAAGSILSGFWADGLAIVLSGVGWSSDRLPAEVIATIVLLLAPAIILLFNGPKYTKKAHRTVSALAIGVLTAAFLVRPLGGLMSLEGAALDVYKALAEYWQFVVGAGLVMGVIDLFTLHTAIGGKIDKKKH